MTTLKEIGMKERTAIVEKYLKKCGTTLSSLKKEIARLSIDYTGTLEENYSLLLRIFRKTEEISMEYYQNVEDVCVWNDHDRLGYEFSLYFYRNLLSGRDLREDEDGEDYEILDGDKVVGKISLEDLRYQLVDDLIERNEGRFNEEFEEFLNELYNWILEVD